MKTEIKKLLIVIVCCGFLVGQAQVGRADKNNADLEAPTPQFPQPNISSTLPTQIAFGPGVTSAETARPFFDYFSWQSFVAMNWPAAKENGRARRGVPDTGAAITIGSPGTRVWESYKADWELFRPGGAAPTAWASYDLNPPNSGGPCGNVTDAKMIAMVTKMDSVIDGINQAFSGPLVDQSRNYVRYEIHVNQDYYDRVVTQRWYLAENLSVDPNRPNEFPDQAIEIKASWKELVEGRDDASRYYTVDALVVSPGPAPTCRAVRMGLVGLHIANKVAHFREWVWSTFEHVDNVPEGAPVAGQNYSFNNGTNTPATTNGFDHRPARLPDNQPLPPITDPARNPVQVTRFTPISTPGQAAPTTDEINAQWQAALSGTVWRFFNLVATQWPEVTDGANFKVKRSLSQPGSTGVFPQNADTPFPANNVANVSMETYFQNNQSCMKCHYNASQDDFSFLPSMRAFRRPPVFGPSLNATERARRTSEDRINRSPSLRNLREAIQP